MTRLIRKVWIAGIVLLAAGGFASANEQARLFPLERAAAGMLFFPYPAVVSTASARPSRTLHAHFHYGDVAALPATDLSLRADAYPSDRQYSQSLSPYSFRDTDKSRDEFASSDDDWHFSANPQIGVNHEGEKGMRFSVRRGF